MADSVARKEPPGSSKISICFNQDYSCCVVSVDRGIIVYSCDPLKERFRRDLGGVPLIVEPLFRSNLLAFVGGRYPPNKVQIWDDLKPGVIADLEFRTPVKNVKIRRDRICVALEDRVMIYNFVDLRLLGEIPTMANPSGLLAISPDGNLIVICPGNDVGLLHIESFDTPTHQTHMLRAHNGPLRNIVISCDGSMVATASDKGTIVRVFDTKSGVLLHELRRGIDQTNITSIAFNSINTHLALVSDKGTVHVYNLVSPGSVGYLSKGERSVAKFYMQRLGHYVCAFGYYQRDLDGKEIGREEGKDVLLLFGEDRSCTRLVIEHGEIRSAREGYFMKTS